MTNEHMAKLDFGAIGERYPIHAIDVNGAQWRFITAGREGPVLLLLPGAQGTPEIFVSQLDAFGADCRVISAFYPAISDGQRLSQSLLGFLDAMRIERCSIFGASFAGYWTQIFAAAHPDRVATLFIAASFVDPSVLQERLPTSAQLAGQEASAIQESRMRQVDAMPDGLLKSTLLEVGQRQSPESLKSRVIGLASAKPTPPLNLKSEHIVVIDCEDDPVIPATVRAQVRKRYAGSQSYVLKTGGHFPALVNPSAVNEIIRRHIIWSRELS